MADTNRGIWTCKIGEVDRAKLPSGSDNYMRGALGDVYESLVGERPTFIFSGWGGELTEPERAVVEDREPAQPMADTLSTEEILSIFPKAVVEEIQQEWAAFIADEYNSRSWTALYHLAKAFAPPPRFIAIDPDELRALRESHDALVEALREQGFVVRAGAAHEWHADNCHGFDTDCGNRRCELVRAALAKAEALHG